MNTPVECRSVLYIPASNERALAKGPSLACDVVLVDLEDSVVDQAKSDARLKAISALRVLEFGYRVRALRINAIDTPWYADDIEAASQCEPDILVIPKVDAPEHIAQLSQAMDTHPGFAKTRIWAMMESPKAVLNAQAIAASSQMYPRLCALLVGSNDLALAAGMPVNASRHLLVPWMMTLVAAAKAYGLQIVDAVYNDFSDVQGLTSECNEGVAMGMNGKTLIHPSQLQIANTAFSPTQEQISIALAIVSAFAQPEHKDAGAIAIDGRMTERLHLGMAEQLLERVERLRLRR